MEAITVTGYYYYTYLPATRLLTVLVLCLRLLIISVCALCFLNFRRDGTSEERENMLLREQGMAGNQDTIPYGLLGGWVGGLIDDWVGRSVIGWMDGWVGGWVGARAIRGHVA